MGLLCAALCAVTVAGVTLITAFIVRIFVILRHGCEHKPGQKGSVSVLVVAGSGGHTTEIIRLMGSLSGSYNPRHYVVADTDHMSEEKIRAFEAERERGASDPQFTLHRIPRSREVCQSWSSSVLSSLNALLSSFPLVFRLQPDVGFERRSGGVLFSGCGRTLLAPQPGRSTPHTRPPAEAEPSSVGFLGCHGELPGGGGA